MHTADTFLRIARFADDQSESAAHMAAAWQGRGHSAGHADASTLTGRLMEARRALDVLAELTNEQLNAVPPAGQARFCDGKRALQQVLAAMLKHQGHQIDALKAALAAIGARGSRG